VMLAGCSESPTPSAHDRSICTTVKTEWATVGLRSRAPNSYVGSESKHLLKTSQSASSVVVFVQADFVEELIHSGDATFQRVGHSWQDSGSPDLVTQLRARCSAPGL
jgi:hypothetical protein